MISDANLVDEGQEIYVTIAGLANTYSSYVATFEEYQAQRYEVSACGRVKCVYRCVCGSILIH